MSMWEGLFPKKEKTTDEQLADNLRQAIDQFNEAMDAAKSNGLTAMVWMTQYGKRKEILGSTGRLEFYEVSRSSKQIY